MFADWLENQKKGAVILSLYYLLILVGGACIGQLAIRAEIIRSVIGVMLGLSVIILFRWEQVVKSGLLKDPPFLLMFIFAVYASCLGFFYSYWDVVAHAGGLLVVFYVIYASVMQFHMENIKTFYSTLNCIVFLYVITNIIFLLFFPEKVLEGGVFSFHADHPFMGLIHTSNSSADVLYVSCLLACCGLLHICGSLSRVLAIFSVIVLLLLIFLSESRSAFFAMIFFIVSFVFYYLLFKNTKKVLTKKILLLIVIGGVLLYVRLSHFYPHFHLFDSALKGRPLIWRSVIGYTFSHNHYLFGFGLGRQDLVLQNFTFDSVYTKSHNTFIDIFVGTGLMGLVLFLIFWGTTLGYLLKWAFQKKSASFFFFLVAFITLTIHSFVESYLINQLSPDLFAMILFYALAKRNFQLGK